MATTWTQGVPWHRPALESAAHHGTQAVNALCNLARAYRENQDAEGLTVEPAFDRSGRDYDNRVRVTRGDYAIIMTTPERVVLGYSIRRCPECRLPSGHRMDCSIGRRAPR